MNSWDKELPALIKSLLENEDSRHETEEERKVADVRGQAWLDEFLAKEGDNLRQADQLFDSGIFRANLGDPYGAINDFTNALAVKPDYAAVFVTRAAVFESAGKEFKALHDLDTAIRLKPTYAVAFNNRGMLLRKIDSDLSKALDDLDSAIRLNPKESRFLNNRAMIFRDKGDLSAAILDLTSAIALNPPDLAALYNNRGCARYEKGNRVGAMEDLRTAIRLKPDYRAAVANLDNVCHPSLSPVRLTYS